MRKILFRGKDCKTKKWVYGAFYLDCSAVSKTVSSYIIPHGQIIYVDKHDFHQIKDVFCVNLETVGQYTGLIDKNGIKIFEGDIVIITRTYDDENINFFVIIEDIKIIPEEFYGSSFTYSEVIGNIHDNPKLLEKK